MVSQVKSILTINEALQVLNEEFQKSYETPAETAKRRRGMLLDRLRTRRLTEELSGETAV